MYHTEVLNFILGNSAPQDSGPNESRVYHLQSGVLKFEIKARLINSNPIEYEIDSVVIK